jgi:CBS domain-containing protein
MPNAVCDAPEPLESPGTRIAPGARQEFAMTVSDLMSSPVESINADVSVADARAMMRSRRIHHLAVMHDEHVVGIVSAHDLGPAKPTAGRNRQRVADVMSRHVMTVRPATTVERAAFLMRGRSISCLVVLERGQVAGIITTADLLGRLAPEARRRKRADSRAIHHRVAHRHRRGTPAW